MRVTGWRNEDGKQQRDGLLCPAQQNYPQQTRKNGAESQRWSREYIWNMCVPVNFPQGFSRDRLKPVWSDLHPCSVLTRPVLMSRAPSCPAWTRALWITPSLIPPNPQQPRLDSDGLHRGVRGIRANLLMGHVNKIHMHFSKLASI